MTIIIIVFVCIFILKNVFIAIQSNKESTQNTSAEYYLSNNSVSWVGLGFTIFASWMSVWAYLGAPGAYYGQGLEWLLTHGFTGVGTPLLLWFIGRKMWFLGKKNGYITPGDLLADFHKSKYVRLLTGLISIAALIPYCLVQLIGIGKVVASSTGGDIPFWIGVVVAGLVIAFYSYTGGIKAVIKTDIYQGILFGIVMIVVASIVLFQAGGFLEGMGQSFALKPHLFIPDQAKIGVPLTSMFMWSLGFIVLPHLWQRTYMAKSSEELSKAILLSSVLSGLFITFPACIIGLISIGLIPGLLDVDLLMPTLISQYFTYGLPFLVVGAFAAGMSTVDSQLLTASSVMVRDIVEPLLNIKLSKKREKTVGRLFVLAFVILLVSVALSHTGQGNIIIIAGKGISIALVSAVPLLFPLMLNIRSKWGGIVSLTVGLIATILLEFNIVDLQFPRHFGPAVLVFLLEIILYYLFYLIEKLFWIRNIIKMH